MKQIIQDLKSGETMLVETPSPMIKRGHVLIQSKYSLVSSGTERMLLEFGKAGWIEKARQQPERVNQVISKIKTDGLIPTLETVLRKLETPIPLGYCNAGIVIGFGSDVTEFQIGDRVVSNGHHAEIVNIGKNLVCKIPDEIDFDEAAFTVVGAIALQGIRLVKPQLGEYVAVIGMGLIGSITAQLLQYNGCKVIGIETDPDKIEFAKKLGIACILATDDDESYQNVMNLTKNYGVDSVIITASTRSDKVISQAAKMCRKRGKIVLVGVVGLDINRSDFYEKELSFQVSCSYGPGRYDHSYEQDGIDYPYAYVRWTERRNFEAVLDAIKRSALKVKDMIGEVVDLDNYQTIYQKLNQSKLMASLIKYDNAIKNETTLEAFTSHKINKDSSGIGLLGAGNFTSTMVLPMMSKLNANISAIASSTGLTASLLAKKYNIPMVTTDYDSLIQDPKIKSVIIATRHDSHAGLVQKALRENKNVFVEKPLAIHSEQLQSIVDTLHNSKGSLTVGYNRRFSPAAILLKAHLAKSEAPMQLNFTMNAGFLPKDHWTQNIEIGGGRIIGEACHYFDLAAFLTGSFAKEVMAQSMGDTKLSSDNVSILIKYQNGSTAVINYFSNGNKSYPKERVEVFQNNVIAILDNFTKLNFYGSNSKNWSGTQDKGHKDQYKKWLSSIQNGGSEMIDLNSLINTSKLSFAVIESLKTGNNVRII